MLLPSRTRTSQSPQSHGTDPPHDRHENRDLRQLAQGAHPAHHLQRSQPLPLPDHREPEGRQLGHPHGHLLGTDSHAAAKAEVGI